MKILKRGALVAAMAAASVALTAGSASASISPDPYSSSTDSGTFTTVTALGTSICDLSDVTSSLTGLTGGASGSITGMTISNCSGVILDATSLASPDLRSGTGPVSVTLLNGSASATNVNVLVVTAFGTCLYSGSLSGTWTSPTSSITVGNRAFPLSATLFGFCSSEADVSLTTNSGATISNP